MHPILLLLTLFILCSSCKKDPEPVPISDDYWGEASAQKDNRLWTANPVCYVNPVDKVTWIIKLDSFWNVNHLVENLDFIGIPPSPGTYKVYEAKEEGKVRAYLTFWDSDLPLGLYRILELDSTNRLTIQSFDSLSREIRATFDLTFTVQKRPYPSTPDTIRFRDGKIHGKLLSD